MSDSVATAPTPSPPAPHDPQSLIGKVREAVAQVVIGQDAVVERMLLALLTGGTCSYRGCRGWPKRSWSAPWRGRSR